MPPPLGPNALSGSSASSKKSGGGIFGSVAHGLGSAFNVVKSVPSALGTIASQGSKELGISPGQILEQAKNIDPFYHANQSKMVGGLAKGTAAHSLASIRQNAPLSYGLGTSLARTARQIPDTAVGTFEPGVGFGKTDLGRQVKTEGVLNTGLAKVGDLAMLAGGAGLLGKAAGFGRLAEMSKLGEAADASIAALHTGETVESAAKASRLAAQAAEAGDTSRAANLEAIAKTLGKKEALEALGPATAAERATAAAAKASTLGAHVAGGPAEVYVKGAGLAAKGLRMIPGVEEAAAHVGEAVRGSKLMEARSASKLIKEASSEHLTGEQARLNGGIVHSMKGALAAAGGDPTVEAAAILRHTGSADALAKLADLPDEHLAPLLEQHVGPGFTPEALRLAVSPTPEVEAAQAKFGEAVASHEGHFVKQYGNKADLSEAALANRAHGVEHPLEPLPIALEKETARRTGAIDRRLGAVEDEAAAIRQRNLEPQRGELTPAAKTQVARDEGVTATRKSIARQLRKAERVGAKGAEGAAARTEATTAERAARLQNEADRRVFRNDQARLATLDERKANYTQKRESMVKEVAESPKVAPKAARSLLLQSKGIADELRQHGDPALAALADALPKNLDDLKGAGVEPRYAAGGTDEAKSGSRRVDSAQVTRKKLAAETEAHTGTMPATFKAQGEKLMAESRGMARNEFGPKISKLVAEKTGVARVSDLFKEHPDLRGLKGEELSAALKEAGYRPWEPNGSGRLIPAGKLDTVHAGTPVLPEAYAGKVDQIMKVAEGEPRTYAQMVKDGTLKAFDRATAGARIAKLIEPGWQLKKTLGDPVMLAAMGVNPIDAALHFPEAFKAVREGNLTPGLGASSEGRLALDEPKTALGRGARKATNGLFTPFGKADALAREIAYRAKLADGLSPSAAAAEVKRGLGDLQHMTSAEKNVLKRTFTFYPWQRHVAEVMARLPVEHPVGVAQATHINQIANQADPNSAQSHAALLTNPFESSGLSMVAENPARGVATIGSTVNPLVRAALVGATGADPAKGFGQISAPNRPYGAPAQPGLLNPIEYAKFLAELAPPVKTAQNVLNTEPAKGGALPIRYSTGEPVRAGTKHKGAVKATTLGATSRKQALLQILGWDPTQAPAKKK